MGMIATRELVRRKIGSRFVEPRPRGRRSAEYEYGFLAKGGKFFPGNPAPVAKKRGRPPLVTTVAASAANKGMLAEIDRAVKQEVRHQLLKAKVAAVAAFEAALAQG